MTNWIERVNTSNRKFLAEKRFLNKPLYVKVPFSAKDWCCLRTNTLPKYPNIDGFKSLKHALECGNLENDCERSTFAKFWRKPLYVLIQKLLAQLVSAMFIVDLTMQIYSELETFKQSWIYHMTDDQ